MILQRTITKYLENLIGMLLMSLLKRFFIAVMKILRISLMFSLICCLYSSYFVWMLSWMSMMQETLCSKSLDRSPCKLWLSVWMKLSFWVLMFLFPPPLMTLTTLEERREFVMFFECVRLFSLLFSSPESFFS